MISLKHVDTVMLHDIIKTLVFVWEPKDCLLYKPMETIGECLQNLFDGSCTEILHFNF